MSKEIVFIHGAWVSTLCWEKFSPFFEQKGYKINIPPWPYKDQSVEEQNKNPNPNLKKLGLVQIVDHYAEIIKQYQSPPILIGHSFGGLIVQMLLDRGLGNLGIAIDPAPPKGILPFRYPSIFRSTFFILRKPFGGRRIHRMNFKQFRYAFIHLLPKEEQMPTYQRYVVPESGKLFFQSAFSMFNNATKVNFKNNNRAPLLIIAGEGDKIVPAGIVKTTFKKYRKSSAKTELKLFPNRCHWLIAQQGWEEIANFVNNWITQN